MQNAPEKTVIIDPPSPNFNASRNASTERGELSSQVIANVEHNLSGSNIISNRPLELNYIFENKPDKISKDNVNMYVEYDTSSNTSTHKSDTAKAETVSTSEDKIDSHSVGGKSCEALELNIQEILALDIEFNKRYSTSSGGGGGNSSKHTNEKIKSKHLFKSLPNLSASSENLLV